MFQKVNLDEVVTLITMYLDLIRTYGLESQEVKAFEAGIRENNSDPKPTEWQGRILATISNYVAPTNNPENDYLISFISAAREGGIDCPAVDAIYKSVELDDVALRRLNKLSEMLQLYGNLPAQRDPN